MENTKKKMLPSETSAYKVVKQTNGNSKNLENKWQPDKRELQRKATDVSRDWLSSKTVCVVCIGALVILLLSLSLL